VTEDLGFVIILLITAILIESSPHLIQLLTGTPVLSDLWRIAVRRWWRDGFSLFDTFLFMIREAANFPIASYLFFAAKWALEIIIAMGLIKIWLKYADGIKGGFRDLFSCVPLFFEYLFGSILCSLIVLAGLALLVVPGIVLAYLFSSFLK
jgi:hypothetical protein